MATNHEVGSSILSGRTTSLLVSKPCLPGFSIGDEEMGKAPSLYENGI
jgi:hypothetical protein